MSTTKPTIVVFFGGSRETADLSQETGYWMCNYIPRSKYRVVPVKITAEDTWQVPLGALPQQGPVTRMMDMLFQSVRAAQPRQGLERLLRHPIAAMMTTLRGKGGDDGSLQKLGDVLNIPVMGSDSSTSHQASHKDLLATRVDDIVASPQSLHFNATTPDERIIRDVAELLEYPLFVKPATTEGSAGVRLVETAEELLPAIAAAKSLGEILIQEKAPGIEMNVTIVEDEAGHRSVLPTTLIDPRHAPFYDQLAKRREGRVGLHTTTDRNRLIREVETIASDIFDDLNFRGYGSFDVMADQENGVSLLEANTIPTLTTVTPFHHQLAAAHLHPARFVDSLITHTLNEG